MWVAVHAVSSFWKSHWWQLLANNFFGHSEIISVFSKATCSLSYLGQSEADKIQKEQKCGLHKSIKNLFSLQMTLFEVFLFTPPLFLLSCYVNKKHSLAVMTVSWQWVLKQTYPDLNPKGCTPFSKGKMWNLSEFFTFPIYVFLDTENMID